jgi:hypothetical protein
MRHRGIRSWMPGGRSPGLALRSSGFGKLVDIGMLVDSWRLLVPEPVLAGDTA